MTDIDKKIGVKIKKLRKQGGLSQISLAERVNLSFQQIQKYEKGETTISVFRLQQIASALEVTLTFFLDHERGALKVSSPSIEYEPEYLPPLTKEEITFLKMLRKFRSKEMKQLAINLVKETLKAEKVKKT